MRDDAVMPMTSGTSRAASSTSRAVGDHSPGSRRSAGSGGASDDDTATAAASPALPRSTSAQAAEGEACTPSSTGGSESTSRAWPCSPRR
jgi:hypothetical protein